MHAVYFKARTREVFLESEGTIVRVLLAAASIAYAILLYAGDYWDKPAAAWMAAAAPKWVWAIAFLLHSFGVVWRTYDRKPRIWWGLAVNGLGIFIWLLYIVLVSCAIRELSPSLALESIVTIAAIMVQIRTGHNEGKGNP